jgi:hypothetical protein
MSEFDIHYEIETMNDLWIYGDYDYRYEYILAIIDYYTIHPISLYKQNKVWNILKNRFSIDEWREIYSHSYFLSKLKSIPYEYTSYPMALVDCIRQKL